MEYFFYITFFIIIFSIIMQFINTMGWIKRKKPVVPCTICGSTEHKGVEKQNMMILYKKKNPDWFTSGEKYLFCINCIRIIRYSGEEYWTTKGLDKNESWFESKLDVGFYYVTHRNWLIGPIVDAVEDMDSFRANMKKIKMRKPKKEKSPTANIIFGGSASSQKRKKREEKEKEEYNRTHNVDGSLDMRVKKNREKR